MMSLLAVGAATHRVVLFIVGIINGSYRYGSDELKIGAILFHISSALNV